MKHLILTEKSARPTYPPFMLDNWQIYCPLVAKEPFPYSKVIPIPSHLRNYCVGKDIFISPNGNISIGKHDFNLNGKKLICKKVGIDYKRRNKNAAKNQIFQSEIPTINNWLEVPPNQPLPEFFFRNQLGIYDEVLADIQSIFDEAGVELEWRPDCRKRIRNAEIYQDFHSCSDLGETIDLISRVVCSYLGEPGSVSPELDSSKPWRCRWSYKLEHGLLRNKIVNLKLYQKSITSYRLEIQAKDVSFQKDSELYGFMELGRQVLLVAEDLARELERISEKIKREDPRINDEDKIRLTNAIAKFIGDITAEKNKTCLESFLNYGVYTPSKHKGRKISRHTQKKLSDPITGICDEIKPPSEYPNTPKTLHLRTDWKLRIQHPGLPSDENDITCEILPKETSPKGLSRRDFLLNLLKPFRKSDSTKKNKF